MQAFLTHIAAHPYLALAIVFLVAFLESVALVGTLVPAAIVMFAAGALIGTGTLDLPVTLGVATLGAVLGDGLSYELGRTFSTRIKGWPILKRYLEAFKRAERYVQRHGGKSILFARFIGPLRATVPLVAGVACLPRVRFYLVNIGSALLWAPVHILPGVLFGASIRIAEKVTTRLALLLLVITGLLWSVVWLVRVAFGILLPGLRRLRDDLLLWAAQRHSPLARAIRFFFDPAKPESEVLLVLALLLLASGWLFVVVLEQVVDRALLAQVDVAVFNFLQGVRTSAIDHLMLWITALGGVGVLLPLVVVVLLWLLAHRCWHTAGYWLAAAAFYQVAGQLLKYLLAKDQPTGLYGSNLIEQFSFPSGHATASMVIYSFLAFLLCRRQPPPWRNTITVIVAIGITMIGFSRVYLGAHWFSDVVAGFSLGFAWVTLLAMVYTHHRVDENLRPKRMALLALAALCALEPWHMKNHLEADRALYAPRRMPHATSIEDWTAREWRQVPLRRTGTGGDAEEPLPLQWAADPADLSRSLAGAGWRTAPQWSAQNALLWLAPDTSVADLPVLPKFDRGHRSRLAFVYFDPGEPMKRTVLRLWRSDIEVRVGADGRTVPVWYGGIYHEEFRRPWRLATLGVTMDVAAAPMAFGHWPRDARWIAHDHLQGGMRLQVFLILPAHAPVDAETGQPR